MVFDGLTSSFDGLHMVEQASLVARELGISREEQDEWAFRSQQRAAAAQDAGRFDDEIVAGRRRRRADEGVRRDTTLEKLAVARSPSSIPDGTTTAGQRAGRQRRRVVRRRLLGGVRERDAGSSRSRRSSRRGTSRTTSPISRARRRARASRRSRRPGKTIDDVARVEINEAFSSVAMNSTRMLGADEEIVNVNGGAVALGHPIGASGGRHRRDAGPRPAPERRRPRPRRHLLGRRAGRRAADRGLAISHAPGCRLTRIGAHRVIRAFLVGLVARWCS